MRSIDAELLTINIAQIAKNCARSDAQKALIGRILYMIDNMPTIEAEPVNDWISVKDRLPPTGVPILIYVYNIEEMTVVSLDHDGLGFSNDDEWFNIKNIHHWRHLPKPPKGE